MEFLDVCKCLLVECSGNKEMLKQQPVRNQKFKNKRQCKCVVSWIVFHSFLVLSSGFRP